MSGINTSEFAKETDLACLKSNVNKLNIDQLKTVPTNLRKLSNLIVRDVVKKTVYDELVKKMKTSDWDK